MVSDLSIDMLGVRWYLKSNSILALYQEIQYVMSSNLRKVKNEIYVVSEQSQNDTKPLDDSWPPPTYCEKY